MKTDYETEWERQRARTDLSPDYIPVHCWYLRLDEPWQVKPVTPPRDGLKSIRAENPAIHFYRYLYHTVGEEFLWGDRRRMSDEDLLSFIQPDHIHLMVLYENGTPAGFYEMDFGSSDYSKIVYFGLLPGKTGSGLGSYMLNQAICYAASHQKQPLILDTCTLDHPAALENYRKRGFVVYDEKDRADPDPRLDGLIPKTAGAHVPLPG